MAFMPSPTTFGVKLAYAYAEFARAKDALAPRANGGRNLRHFGARSAPSRKSTRAWKRMSPGQMGLAVGAGLDPNRPARPPRHVFRDPRRDRFLRRAACDRIPPSAAHRGLGGRGILLRRTKGLVAPCRTSATRCSARTSPGLPASCAPVHAGTGERGALARARHLALLGRAHDRARTPPRRSTSARRPPASSKLVVYPENMQKISTGSAGSCIPSAC